MGQKLRVYKRRLAYGVGHVFNDLTSTMWFTYLVIYYERVLEFGPNLAGYALLIGQLADGIYTPFIGFETDYAQFCKKYGSRKFWHLVGSVKVAISFPFIFNKCFFSPDSSSNAQMVYYSALIVIFQMGWATIQISHLSMLPTATKCKIERVVLNSIRYFFSVLSNFTVFILAFFLLQHDDKENINKSSIINSVFDLAEFLTKSKQTSFNSLLKNSSKNEENNNFLGPNDLNAFSIITGIIMGSGLFVNILFHIFFHEYPMKHCINNPKKYYFDRYGYPYERKTILQDNECPEIRDSCEDQALLSNNVENTSSVNDDDTEIEYLNTDSRIMTWKCWFKEPQFYLINLIYLLTRLIVNVTQVYFPFYLQDVVLLSKQYTALMPLVIYVASMLTSFVLKKIRSWIGIKLCYLIGILIVSVFCLLIFFLPYPLPHVVLIYLISILMGIGNSFILVGSLSMVADLIDHNTESGAFVYGAMSFSDKVSNGVVVAVIQSFIPATSTETSRDLYRYIEAFVPLGCCLLAFVVFLILWPQRIGVRRVQQTTESINNVS